NWLISNNYGDKSAIERRIYEIEEWISNPVLLAADLNAEYEAVIDINLDDIKEPILACPNDPNNVKLLSEVAGDKIDEVFIGSCMTNIEHFRSCGKLLEGKRNLLTRLWIAPPTRIDNETLRKEGYFNIFCQAGARIEIPGCSLCMGNQARVNDKATVVSTSTRNFPNRMGKDSKVYLASAEVATISAILGKIPSLSEYLKYMQGNI
ncbi:MAG: aconitate hydratase B, partial [Desulfobacterales bacterium]|nr:aconitate hydratase B [Desulfobacterales bacterium]